MELVSFRSSRKEELFHNQVTVTALPLHYITICMLESNIGQYEMARNSKVTHGVLLLRLRPVVRVAAAAAVHAGRRGDGRRPVAAVLSGPGDPPVPVLDGVALAVAGVPVSHRVELAAAVVAAAAPVALALPVHVLAAAVRAHRVALVRSANMKKMKFRESWSDF